jgi:hypothetical protein
MHFTSESTSDGDEKQQQIKNLKQLPRYVKLPVQFMSNPKILQRF